ncbi:MAG: hypothetical protein V4819_12635 [Verrucomicrobiota bacterium]
MVRLFLLGIRTKQAESLRFTPTLARHSFLRAITSLPPFAHSVWEEMPGELWTAIIAGRICEDGATGAFKDWIIPLANARETRMRLLSVSLIIIPCKHMPCFRSLKRDVHHLIYYLTPMIELSLFDVVRLIHETKRFIFDRLPGRESGEQIGVPDGILHHHQNNMHDEKNLDFREKNPYPNSIFGL